MDVGLAAASQIFQNAYEMIIDQTPLGDDAEEQQRETLPYLHRLAALSYLHVTGLMHASGLQADPNIWVEVGARVGITELGITADQRLWDITHHELIEVPVMAGDWIYRLVNPTKLSKYRAEQEAFVSLLRGYESADEEEVLLGLIGSEGYDGRFDTLCQTSVDIEETDDVQARLVQRHNVISDLSIDNAMQRYLHSVLSTIQAIRFAREWEQLDNAAKTTYRLHMFDVIHPAWDEYTEAGLKKAKNTFNSRHDKVIKGRKDIKRLFDKFGVAVLMDPTWAPTVCYSKGTTGRTNLFPATLNLVLDHELLGGRKYFASNGECLEQLMSIVGGQVEKYVMEFVSQEESKDV